MNMNEIGAPSAPSWTGPAPTKEAVEDAIKKSSTLVEALESVAAMYQIPSENIIVDDRVNSIRVTGDCITTPDKTNPSANTKAIVCAIGAVLDNISQRIDQKLNAYQNTQIQQNKTIANQKQADPSKGDVVGRFFDANGGEIVAYSSGLVDSDNTPAANAKINELRASKQIPDFVYEPNKQPNPSSYFSAEENDIMSGVPKTNDTIKMDIDKQVTDLANKFNESAYFMDLMAKFNDTTTLGYDLLQSQGFDYVQPTHGMVQEADDANISAPKASDLKHMRFDNKRLLKAIELFNAARLSFMDSNPSLKDICRNDKFKKGIRCIEDQFDCQLAIRFYNLKDEDGRELTLGQTQLMNDITQPITVSKSKGFQLHGMPIDIDFAGKIFDFAPSSKQRELFGQTVLSIILHEIWHNISCSLEKENGQFIFTVSSGVMLASATDNVHNRRVILCNCVNTLTEMSGKKINRITKRRMVNQLMAIASTKFDERALENMKDAAVSGNMEDLDKYMASMEKYIDKHKGKPAGKKTFKGLGKRIVGSILFAIGALMTILHFLIPLGLLIAFGGARLDTWGREQMGSSSTKNKEMEKQLAEWLQKANKEEYYADLFASMYHLTPVFGFGPGAKYTANQIDHARLQKLVNLERELGKIIMDPHPTDQERAYAAVTIAKKLLASGEKLDPAIKKYNEWIVANYSSLEDTNLKEVYSDRIFDPKEAEDMDKHLQSIVSGNNIQVTESVQ